MILRSAAFVPIMWVLVVYNAHFIYLTFFCSIGPKVKTDLPVLPKPKRDQSQPTIKPQTAAAPQPKQIDLMSAQPHYPSLEYIALREMLADFVDLLAGNAAVIVQLNNHLFSSGLIPIVIYSNSSSRPYDRATELINAVLATLECHPNPNSVFTSLITVLHKVRLTIIATKLTQCLSKFMHH